MNRYSFLKLLFVVTFTTNFCHGQQFDYNNFFDSYTSKFPYKVEFTENETLYLKKLNPATLQKIQDFARNLYNKNTQTNILPDSSSSTLTNKSTSSSTALQPTTSQPSTAKALNTLLNSLFKPNTPQNNLGPKPPAYSGASGLTDSDLVSNPNFNPASAPQDSPPLRAPLGSNDVADFSKLPPAPHGSCPNFGVNGNMNGISNKIKLDTNCLCIAFGGQLKMVSGYRPGDPRNHGQGLAIDIAENNYRDPKKDAMLVVALIALKYNIGSYHPGFGSFHADRENSNKWKTWSGVAHTNYQGAYARNYYMMVQDALNLIGTPAISSAQFRGTYGNPTQDTMAAKAKVVVEKFGNDNLKKCVSGNY